MVCLFHAVVLQVCIGSLHLGQEYPAREPAICRYTRTLQVVHGVMLIRLGHCKLQTQSVALTQRLVQQAELQVVPSVY